MTAAASLLLDGPAFVRGWLMSAGLIVAIGAQNALVLRQGLARSHVGLVVALCVASDWLLIAAGVYGLGALIAASPQALELLRWGGAAWLIGYGALAAKRALASEHAVLSGATGAGSLKATLATTLAMTWLNPHVY
ncbi:MAG TPA: LysE family transporter, partial [Methylibium sp.]